MCVVDYKVLLQDNSSKTSNCFWFFIKEESSYIEHVYVPIIATRPPVAPIRIITLKWADLNITLTYISDKKLLTKSRFASITLLVILCRQRVTKVHFKLPASYHQGVRRESLFLEQKVDNDSQYQSRVHNDDRNNVLRISFHFSPDASPRNSCVRGEPGSFLIWFVYWQSLLFFVFFFPVGHDLQSLSLVCGCVVEVWGWGLRARIGLFALVYPSLYLPTWFKNVPCEKQELSWLWRLEIRSGAVRWIIFTKASGLGVH